MASTGFQALILCGPGASLNPFNSNPKDFPKALVPVANRPMVWYPLDWCHRMGITDITLIIPPESLEAIESQLAVNPYLTTLPSPKPTLLAPEELTLTTGTAEIFRLPEVQKTITSDFLILPCDLISDLPGSTLLEEWLTLQGGLGSASGGEGPDSWGTPFDVGGERSGRRGGLGVWYETKDKEEGGVGVKREETDFLATTEVDQPAYRASPRSLRSRIRNVVTAMPMDALKDIMDEQKALRLRHQLLKKHGRVRIQTTLRDAHIYVFPYWVKQYMALNDAFESIGEDVLGWWAKSGWQDGLVHKLHLSDAMRRTRRKSEPFSAGEDDTVDIAALSSTRRPKKPLLRGGLVHEEHVFASRVGNMEDSGTLETPSRMAAMPPVLAYVHPAPTTIPTEDPAAKSGKQQQKSSKGGQEKADTTASAPHVPLIRRADTVPLLLSISLYLARLPASTEANTTQIPPTPLSHHQKLHPTSTIPSHSTIDQRTVLIDANCTLQPKITLRECVIGANCSIASGSRLQRCVLMDNVVIEERVTLTGCVLGRRCKIGRGAELRDCQVQDGYAIGEATTSKGEVFAGFDEGDVDEMDALDEEDGEGEGLSLA